MDYGALAAALNELVPFAAHVGVHVEAVGPGSARVTLPDGAERTNHVGSQHAGALFTAGEAASGGAFAGTFAERMGEITPLAESAEIAYTKIARGPITAQAKLRGTSDELIAELDSEGRVRFPVAVELTDGDGEVVAEMTVHWYVRKRG
jgi:acyl-coenzyme A thioesterase PaaI-like protein